MSNRDYKHYDYVLGHRTPNIYDHFEIGQLLGKGKLWKTHICTAIDTGIEYACKSTRKRKLVSNGRVEDVRREFKILRLLSQYIRSMATLVGAYEDASHVRIVVELCSGGPAYVLRRCDERRAAELFGTIAGVVAACHFFGVMHRDVQLKNFMFAQEDDDDLSLKAIDFKHAASFAEDRVFKGMVGSLYHAAPEVILGEYGPEADVWGAGEHGPEADVWSAGVVLYKLLTGHLPFQGETREEIFDAVLKGYIDFDSYPWPLISDSAKDLISKMLCVEPSERLNVHEVLWHRWFYENEVDTDRAMDKTVLIRQRMALQAEIDRSTRNIDDYVRADSQCSDQDGSEHNTTFDQPGQRAIHRQDSVDCFSQDVDQDHDGERSKLFESDDEGEYLSRPINRAKRSAEKDVLPRAMNERLISENDALKPALAYKGSNSKNEGLKDLDESEEATKQGKTTTVLQFESMGWGSYILKNFLFKRETNR